MCQVSFVQVIVNKIVNPRHLSIPGSTAVFVRAYSSIGPNLQYLRMNAPVLAYNIAM